MSGLVEHCVLEVNAVSAALERHVVTNRTNTKIHLPLWAFHHRAGRLIDLYDLLTHKQEVSGTEWDIGRLWHGITSFTLAVVLSFFAADPCLEEFSHCSDLCLSPQSATSSSGCSNATSQSLHIIDWFLSLAGSVERNITVTSLEQSACRCPNCKINPSDQRFIDVIKRKDSLCSQKGLRHWLFHALI